MRFNKKAEGTISSMFIVFMIAVAVLFMFSQMLVSLVGYYGVEEAPEFEIYEQHYAELKQNVSSNIIQEGDISGTNESVNPEERYEDGMFKKGIKIVREIPAMLKVSTKVIDSSFDQMGAYQVPAPLKWLVRGLIALAIIVLFARAMLRYNKV